MIEADPEVQQDGSDDGMKEALICPFSVGKAAELVKPIRELLGWWRHMKNLTSQIEDADSVLIGSLKSARRVRVLRCSFADDPMEGEDQSWRQRLADLFPDEL
jgi:hypothetical protein